MALVSHCNWPPRQAHLTALHVIHPFSSGLGVFGDAAAGVITEIESNYQDDARAAVGALVQAAEKRAQKADVPFEWRLEVGLADEIVPVHARYADLTFTGQVDPDSEDALRRRGLAIQLMMDSGRPTLVVPYAGMFATLGKTRFGRLERQP